MEFTKEEKEILEKITGEKEDKEVSYRSFRVYRTVSLWKEYNGRAFLDQLK